jgi:glycosyltransferase involved in cell wall biosynthesis
MEPALARRDIETKSPIVVALVTQFPENPSTPLGGVEAVSVNLTQALARYPDLDIHVVTINAQVKTEMHSTWAGATIHRLPYVGRSTLTNAVGAGRRQLHRYLESLNPDIIHAHDTYGLMVKGLRLPRVFTVHGFIYGDTLVSGQRFAWLRSRLWRYIETGGWADQPHIISISPYVRERLTGLTMATVHDIDNPIAESFFHNTRDEKRNVIFSAAVISPRKNTLMLVEALAKLRAAGCDAELRLAGTVTNEAYGQSLRAKVAEYKLGDRVHLLGSIPSERIVEELCSASVFALVSLEENSPMGIAEAMATGVPVVTSNRCGMPYMVQHGQTGFLVNPLDSGDIARRLGVLLKDDSLRTHMGQKAQRVAEERFYPAVVACRTKEVYLDALER